jgi:transcriptional regulator with XRE-family HTH domain
MSYITIEVESRMAFGSVRGKRPYPLAERLGLPRRSKIAVISYGEIGERVRALRLAHDLTQTQLAKILGTSQTALSEMERGNRGLTVQQVVKLARALKATPNDILGEGKRQRGNGSRPRDVRILRRLHRIEGLPEGQRLAVLKLLDGIIEAHTRATK